MRPENSARQAQPQHEGILRGSDIKESEILQAEAVVVGRSGIAAAVCQNLVPDRKWVLLELPTLLSREIGDGSVEPKSFRFGHVAQAGRGVGRDETVASVPNERNESASRRVCKKALKVCLLLGGKFCRIDGAGHRESSSSASLAESINQRVCL